MKNGLADLRTLERIASELNAEPLADEIRSLAQRAVEGRFYVACVGQFKRGKSTLINALVEESLLPTGTVPVTSVVTVVRHAPERCARVRSAGSEWTDIGVSDLPDYVTETRNPGNRLGITAVEVCSPSHALAGGLCFVDTPGLGSVFEANSDATREFVPHIDAALVLFGADPPITGEEAAIVEEIARLVDTFIFVLNKADRVSKTECDEAAAFAERVLSRRLGRPVDRIYKVSAADTLARREPTRDWADLVRRLVSLAEASGSDLVRSAVDRGRGRVIARLRNVLAEEEAALRAPLEETERRIQALHQASDDAARALWQIGPILDAELRRLGDAFAQRRVEFIRQTIADARSELSDAVAHTSARFGPAARAEAMMSAQEIARNRVLPWLRASERVAAERYAQSAERCASVVNDLLVNLRASENWTDIPLPGEADDDTVLSGRNKFLFDAFERVESPAGLIPALEWLADALLPRALTRPRIERAAQAYLEHLLTANARRVESVIKQRMQDSRMRMESRIRFSLKEILEAAERGLRRARAAHETGQTSLQAELERIGRLREQLEAVAAHEYG